MAANRDGLLVLALVQPVLLHLVIQGFAWQTEFTHGFLYHPTGFVQGLLTAAHYALQSVNQALGISGTFVDTFA